MKISFKVSENAVMHMEIECIMICFFFLVEISVSWSDPLYILTHSKCILTDAIIRDAKFLENNEVMDYSLLVGCATGKVLVLGIIGKANGEIKTVCTI